MKFSYIIAPTALLASAVSAFTVITPNGWTTTGPNQISYTSVDTDQTSFAAVLKASSGTTTILSESHNTSDGNFTVSATCSDLYSTGEGFVINFIMNSTSLNSILAQSQTFNITESTTSCSDSTSASASATTSSTSTTTSSSASDKSSSASTKSSATSSATASSSSSGALSGAGVPSMFVGLVALALVGSVFV
ncbi:hypothetical protein [Phaffia rhodozyma]|uniref:Uncharacterized protein n=1 Tax=Phaffia rhodozyma TaxID=264483 RepID=A0A0F7SEH6_PHARH|nr:hypothetical protein [Phaffia rhodozyma]